MTPSDHGLRKILQMYPNWYDYIFFLGVNIEQVKRFERESLKGLLALQYWRDGHCDGYCNTWKVLLDVIRDQAPADYPDVEKQVAENKNWTLKRSKLRSLYDMHHM